MPLLVYDSLRHLLQGKDDPYLEVYGISKQRCNWENPGAQIIRYQPQDSTDQYRHLFPVEDSHEDPNEKYHVGDFVYREN